MKTSGFFAIALAAAACCAPVSATQAHSPDRAMQLESHNPALNQSSYFHKAQYSVTCHAHNDLGVPFYWVGPNAVVARVNVIRACQLNTPAGASCYFDGCE